MKHAALVRMLRRNYANHRVGGTSVIRYGE